MGGFAVLAATSFTAAVKLHHLTERIANFRENIFHFVILEEQYEDSFWLCVASAAVHGANLLLVPVSWIRFPALKTKTEEANATAEDIMY
uniref:Clarin-2 n=1 Tax=Sphaerodactylus townsendi TaxID=933632 RepID=A0ACB8E6I7_9SAUR